MNIRVLVYMNPLVFNKISKKFKVSEFFERNFSDKYLQRTVE